MHRWLALIISLLLVVIALSGALTVFEGPLSDAAAVRVVPGTRWLPLDSLGKRAIAAANGDDVVQVAFGRSGDEAFGFAVARDTMEQDLLVNPYTGAVLGPVPKPSRLLTLAASIHRFHTSLLAGATGRILVAFVTLSSLVLVLIGLVLWWRDKLWRIRWSASWKRVIFDLHHALGVLAAVVLLIITATGVWMGFPRLVDPVVLRLNAKAAPPGRLSTAKPGPGAMPISLDSIVRAARSKVPGAPVLFVELPPSGPVQVGLRYPEDHTPGGRSRVLIDRYSGTVLRATNTRTAQPGTRIMNLQRPLHTGDIFGVWSQAIWFLSAVILASQAVTGVMMWWNGRAARRAQAAQKTPGQSRAG